MYGERYDEDILEETNILAKEQYKSRKVKADILYALNKRLAFKILRQ